MGGRKNQINHRGGSTMRKVSGFEDMLLNSDRVDEIVES